MNLKSDDESESEQEEIIITEIMRGFDEIFSIIHNNPYLLQSTCSVLQIN